MNSPILIKNATNSDTSFYVNANSVKYFGYPFHFHHEYELTYIIKGTGTRCVGNSIENFGPGDLILIGSNVPHYWRNSKEYYDESSQLTAQSIVVRFLYHLGGVNLFDIPEMLNLKKLLYQSGYGIKITGKCNKKVFSILNDMLASKKEDKIILLLQALSFIAASKKDTRVLMKTISRPINQLEVERINNIYEYMLNHYKNKISLKEIAKIANLQTASFCRYFKKHFRKTFIETLNEIRINEACNLLRNKDMTITHIAYESGYNSLSNFINAFYKITNQKPKEYRERCL